MTATSTSSSGRARWLATVGGLLAALGLVAAGALLFGSDRDEPNPAVSGGPGSRLPPPRSLQELVASGEIIVTAEVTRDLGRRELGAGASSLTIHAVELTVIEYVKGSGPATLTVHQAVSSEDAEQLAYALTAPPVGATGFFFVSPEKSWGVGGWSAAFGPDGRILEGTAGQPVLDREQAPPAAFLAGKTMADVDREIRALLNSGG